MTRPIWKTDGVPASEGGPLGEGRISRRLALGLSSLAGAAGAMTLVALFGGDILAFASRPSHPLPPKVAVEEFSDSVDDITAYQTSGSVAGDGYDWVFNPLYHGQALPHFAAGTQAGQAPAMADSSKIVPLPTPNPLVATARTTVVPLPTRKPQVLGNERVASLPTSPQSKPADEPAATPSPPPPGPSQDGAIPLPTPGSGYAIYDIKGQMVYMPNGDQLEAHSGYGDKMDDIGHVTVRMYGPTPPNTYQLTMREALFHGSEALRLNPVGSGKMHGRTGFLTHPYLMGPNGQSNGCISFKDYDRFLAAYKRGEVKKMIVVASLPNAPEKPNSLLSWLLPKKNAAQ